MLFKPIHSVIRLMLMIQFRTMTSQFRMMTSQFRTMTSQLRMMMSQFKMMITSLMSTKVVQTRKKQSSHMLNQKVRKFHRKEVCRKLSSLKLKIRFARVWLKSSKACLQQKLLGMRKAPSKKVTFSKKKTHKSSKYIPIVIP